MNDLNKTSSLYLQAANQNQDDLLINDGSADSIPVAQYEIVNPDKTETLVELCESL